jgi:hypothetical protein
MGNPCHHGDAASEQQHEQQHSYDSQRFARRRRRKIGRRLDCGRLVPRALLDLFDLLVALCLNA